MPCSSAPSDIPGRLLRPGEVLPQPALDFVAEQIHVTPGELATYAARRQTRQEQLDEQREAFGFRMYGADQAREISAWLLPVALATTDISGIAATLMDEFRRRRIVAPGPTVIERLVAAVLVSAERHVTEQLTRELSPRQTEALDSLLVSNEGAAMSVLAWARQPPGAPNHKALKRTVDQLIRLRAVGLDPACAEGVHPERLRKLAREGGRFTAQHLRALSLPRRRATLVATVLETVTRLTDDAVGLFDRAVGRMVRRAEAREEGAVLRDAKAVGDKVRLLVRLGAALIAAKKEKADLDEAVTVGRGLGQAGRQHRRGRAAVPPGEGGSERVGRPGLAGAASARPELPRRLSTPCHPGRHAHIEGSRGAEGQLCQRRSDMAEEPADQLPPTGLARRSPEQRRTGPNPPSPHLGGRHSPRAA